MRRVAAELLEFSAQFPKIQKDTDEHGEHLLHKLTKLIEQSQNIVLSTHRQCDGDGLGSQLAMYHALKKVKKNVSIINVDATPKKYNFLEPEKFIQVFEIDSRVPQKIDLVLIFDTNDCRLLEPLYSKLAQESTSIAFVDHHPILNQGPQPTPESWIDVKAASTGELCFRVIEDLKIPWDPQMAKAIYTSIVFDTQLFRYVRNSANSHLIAAHLLSQSFDIDEVHRYLFSHQTPEKMNFLAKTLQKIEYTCDGRLGLIRIKTKDLLNHQLDLDDTRDLIDFIMNIDQLDAAVVFREDAPNVYKLSLRSKGNFNVLKIAEMVGGGGHFSASGAFLKGKYEDLKSKIVDEMTKLLKSA